MNWTKAYGYGALLTDQVVAHNTAAFYTQLAPLHHYDQILLFYDVTIALTGGSSPGLKFTLEVDVTGVGKWVAATTLIATGNGFAANAATDPTITSTGVAHRYYPQIPGMQARVKVEVTGTPTGGTATINLVNLVGKR